MSTTTYGAAVEFRTLGGYHLIKESQCYAHDRCGLTHMVGNVKRTFNPYSLSGTPNVSGPRQKAEHRFPDTNVAEDDRPALPSEPEASTIVTTLPSERYAVRQEDIYYQVRWLLMSGDSPIHRQMQDLCDGLQPHDRDDMRQDLCVQHWRRAVAAEYRGIRKYSVGKWLIGDVRRWIGRNIAGNTECTANADPLSAEELRTLSLKSRSATIDKELANEQAASLAAMAKAKPPAPVISFSW